MVEQNDAGRAVDRSRSQVPEVCGSRRVAPERLVTNKNLKKNRDHGAHGHSVGDQPLVKL